MERSVGEGAAKKRKRSLTTINEIVSLAQVGKPNMPCPNRCLVEIYFGSNVTKVIGISCTKRMCSLIVAHL